MKEDALSSLDIELKDIQRELDKAIENVRLDLERLESSLQDAMIKYEEFAQKASENFYGALEELNDGSLKGVFKFALKGVAAAFNYYKAWDGKRKWKKEFEKKLTAINNLRANIISQKLQNVQRVKEQDIPFVREKLKSILKQLGQFAPSDEKVLKHALKSAESALVLYLKTYYIEGAAAYLEAALKDALAGKAVIRGASFWESSFVEGKEELKRLVSSLNAVSGSALDELSKTSQLLRG